MKTYGFVSRFLIILSLSASIFSCIDPDYFAMYNGKNLIGHTGLSGWTPTQNTTYMNYETVSASDAGTSGLPDISAPIYRLEIKNLVPDGDFDLAATPAAAGWTDVGTGTNIITAAGHHLNGNALSFDLSNIDYLEYDLTQLSDSSVSESLYMFRYCIEGLSGSYSFEIQDTVTTTNQTQYFPSIPASGVNQLLNVPADFNEHKTTDFLIHSTDTEVFRINFDTAGQVQAGFFDDFRIIKIDQDQYIQIDVPFEDENRVDSLALLSGTYRLSIYVKADTQLASRNNSFAANGVTLGIKSYDPGGMLGSITQQGYPADEYSSFSDWTEISLDATFQINDPAETSETVIRLSVTPTVTTGGAVTMDAGSILISTPQLYYSESGTF